MAAAKKPSVALRDKENINPSLLRKNEAVDLDFHNIYEVLFDHAEKIDGFTGGNTGNTFYGFHSSLEVLAGAYPNVAENSFAIIEGMIPQIAVFKDGDWKNSGGKAPFVFLNTKFDRPDPGTEGTWYIVKDSNTAWLWYDGKYHEFVMPDLSNYYIKEESDERYATAEQGQKADSAIQEESDPTVPDHVKSITAQDLSNFTQAFQEGLLSGTVTGQENKTVTLTKRNGQVIQFSFEDRYNSETGDGVIDGFVFNKDNGTVTIQTSTGEVITDNFDGRYALLGHQHNFSDLEGTENIETKSGAQEKANLAEQAAKDYADSLTIGGGSAEQEFVEQTYADISELFSDQHNQTDGYIQFVTNAATWTGIEIGYAYFEYLGTTNGNESDYRLLSSFEALQVISGQSFINIDKDEFGDHPAFQSQHDLNAFLLANLVTPYVDLFPDTGRLFRYNFSQDQAKLSDLDGNFPGTLSVGGSKILQSSLVGKAWKTNPESYVVIGRPFQYINLPISVIILVKKLNATDSVPLITSDDASYAGFEWILNESSVSFQVGNNIGIGKAYRRTYEPYPIASDTNYHLIAINIPTPTTAFISIDGGEFDELTYKDGDAENPVFNLNFNIGRRGWGSASSSYTTPAVYDEAAGYARLLSNQEVSDLWAAINNQTS